MSFLDKDLAILATLATLNSRLPKHLATLPTMAIFISVLLLYIYMSRCPRWPKKKCVRVYCKFQDGQPEKYLAALNRYMITFTFLKKCIEAALIPQRRDDRSLLNKSVALHGIYSRNIMFQNGSVDIIDVVINLNSLDTFPNRLITKGLQK